MNKQISQLVEKIRLLEEELEVELARRQAELNFSIQNRKVSFAQEVIRLHKGLKTHLIPYIFQARPSIIVTAPFIYALIVPLMFLDLMITLYQRICFPIYRIPLVQRPKYFVFDRHHLAYLNIIEKINCLYCSYGNGLLSYAKEIAARTEQYWCPIKHAQRIKAAHSRYHDFVDYGDAESYQDYLDKQQQSTKQKKKQEGNAE